MEYLKTKTSQIDVSLVVVSYKNAAVLNLCLAAIFKNIGQELSIEVIVVDGESGEEVRDLVLDNYPKVKFIPLKENIGFAGALNRGIEEAKGETVLSLNPDVIVQKGAVEALYCYAVSHPEAGLIGPMLLNFNGSRQYSCFSFYTPITVLYRRTFLGKIFFGKKSLKKFILRVGTKKPQSILGWLMGSALLARRDNLEKVGLMDERYFMYFEDVDWCRRFREAKLDIVYLPEAKMFHYHSKTSASKSILSLFLNKMTFIHFTSGLKYFFKFKDWKVSSL